MVTISSISTKQSITTQLTKHKKIKTRTYDVRNPDPDLEQAQKCGGFEPVNGAPTLPSQCFPRCFYFYRTFGLVIETILPDQINF